MVYHTVVYKFHINIQSASKEDPSFGERGNSGENPGRSGHCNQGVKHNNPLYVRTYEKECGTMICKSGNLLCMHRVDASDESFHSKTIMGYGMSEIFRKDFQKPSSEIYALH